MLRKLLTIVLPIALPFLAYFLYVTLARARARQRGMAANAPGAADAPWPWLLGVGVVLMAAALMSWRLLSEPAAPGAKIEPPRYIDGEVRPSRIVDEE